MERSDARGGKSPLAQALMPRGRPPPATPTSGGEIPHTHLRGRPSPPHPRLWLGAHEKTWMPATSAGMTRIAAWIDELGSCGVLQNRNHSLDHIIDRRPGRKFSFLTGVLLPVSLGMRSITDN